MAGGAAVVVMRGFATTGRVVGSSVSRALTREFPPSRNGSPQSVVRTRERSATRRGA